MSNKTEIENLEQYGMGLKELQGDEEISLEKKIEIFSKARNKAQSLLNQIEKGGALWQTIKQIGENLINTYHSMMELPIKEVYEKTGGDKERLAGIITGIREILNIPDYWQVSITECDKALKEAQEELEKGGNSEKT